MTADTFHRRPLPADLPAFASPEGRRLLSEALAAGTAGAFFPLVSHLHTQAHPAWCGLGTLVTVLNALEIDPGRTWKGPWRWFGEELLICCKQLELAAAEGLTLAEVACLARCNGARVERVHAGDPPGDGAGSLAGFRAALEASARAEHGPFLVANYDRGVLGQTGTGHFSPLAAWHPGQDLVLVLDVARFKYPPHWVPTERLWRAMAAVDPDSGAPRGWLALRRADGPTASVAEATALAARIAALGAPEVPCCPSVPLPPAEEGP